MVGRRKAHGGFARLEHAIDCVAQNRQRQRDLGREQAHAADHEMVRQRGDGKKLYWSDDYQQPQPYSNALALAHANADANADANSDFYTYPYSYSHANSDSDSYANTYTYTYSYSYANSYANADSLRQRRLHLPL